MKKSENLMGIFEGFQRLYKSFYDCGLMNEAELKKAMAHSAVSIGVAIALDSIFYRLDNCFMSDSDMALMDSHFWFNIVEGIE